MSRQPTLSANADAIAESGVINIDESRKGLSWRRQFTLSLACSGPAAPPRSDNALDEIRQGNYVNATGFRSSITVLDWNVDRAKHADSIIAAAHAAVADPCVS